MNHLTKISVTLLALGPIGCVQAYQPPTREQPHAVLKFRRTYEAKAGTTLNERLMVDEYLAYAADHPTRAVPSAETGGLLIHPVAATITASATFSHQELQMVQERYSEMEPYTAFESYSCGTGTSFRTCTRTVTRYRTTYKTRYVNKWVTVVDGSCVRALHVAPRDGGTYLAQFTYRDHGVCSLSCFEQTPLGAGKFEQRACAYAPPPEE